MHLLGIAFLVFIAIVVTAILVFSTHYVSLAVLFTNLSVVLSYLVGTGIFKDLINAFKISSYKIESYDQNEINKSLAAIKTTVTLIIISGIVGMLLGSAPLLVMYNDLKDVIPYYAFTIISAVYTVFGVLFLLPIKARLISLLKKACDAEMR